MKHTCTHSGKIFTDKSSLAQSLTPHLFLSLSFSPSSVAQGGEVTRPLDPSSVSSTDLPAPLIPLPKGSKALQAEEEQGREAPILTQELDSDLGPEVDVDEPEVGVEAYGEMESSSLPTSPVREVTETHTERTENSDPEEQPAVRGKT